MKNWSQTRTCLITVNINCAHTFSGWGMNVHEPAIDVVLEASSNSKEGITFVTTWHTPLNWIFLLGEFYLNLNIYFRRHHLSHSWSPECLLSWCGSRGHLSCRLGSFQLPFSGSGCLSSLLFGRLWIESSELEYQQGRYTSFSWHPRETIRFLLSQPFQCLLSQMLVMLLVLSIAVEKLFPCFLFPSPEQRCR